VDSDQAEVRDTPNNTGNVIETLKKGTSVAASNLPIEGFHKVRTDTGLIGWINADSLELQPPPSEEVMAQSGAPVEEDPPPPSDKLAEKKDPIGSRSSVQAKQAKPKNTKKMVRIRGFGGIDLFSLSGIVNNFDNFGQGYHYGGEFVFNFSDGFGLVLRGEKMAKSSVLVDSTTGNSYVVDLSSIPLFFGPEFSILGSAFSIHFGILGGIAPQTSLTSTITAGSNVGSSVSVSASHLAFLGRVNLNWQFNRTFSIFMETGYRYAVTPALTPNTTAGAAGEIFKSSFSVNLSGPIVSAGVSVGF
jgi:hypothetical protein